MMRNTTYTLVTRFLLAALLAMQLAGCVSGGGGPATAGSTSTGASGGQATSSGAAITLDWTAPSTRADGSPLSLSDINGYRVYIGSTPGTYSQAFDISDGSATSAVISNIQAGMWYVSMSTIDSNGLEGVRSAEITKTAS